MIKLYAKDEIIKMWEENGGGGGEGTNASPRNKTLLSKLGTRLRGGAGRGKKSSSTTTGSKKSKE